MQMSARGRGRLRIIYSGWGKAMTGSCFVSADCWLCIRVSKQCVRVHPHRTSGMLMASVLRRSNTAEMAPACLSLCVDGSLYCQTLFVNITIGTAFLYVYFLLYVLLTVHPVTILVNNQLDAHFLFMYVYFRSLHVSDSYVSIIRRINCINTTGLDGTAVPSKPTYQTVIYTEWHIPDVVLIQLILLMMDT